MVVVGIDIGTQTCTVAHVGRGAVKILLNETSGRNTPTMVAYNEQARAIGVPAKESFNMNYKHTIVNINRLIGLKYSQIPKQELERLTVPYSQGEGDSLQLHIKGYRGQSETIVTPVQALIALLNNLKALTERETKTKKGQSTGVQCVIAIPPYYTDAQKRTVAAAAEVAGLELLKMIPSTTAAAIEYGLYKELPKENPINVAFVDVGHADTAVSIIQLVEGTLKVKSCAFDSELGARDFEDLLVSHFVKKIKAEHGLDLATSSKAIFRLTTACEKLKKVLTANTSAHAILECIMNDKDIKIEITREEFEEMAATLKANFRKPVEKAIKDSGLSLNEIATVQVIGGGTYIPALRTILQEIFGQAVSTTQNPMEAIAKGCAIQGAMLSRQVRLAKSIKVNDVVIHSIDMGYSETKRMNIFSYPKHSTSEIYKITFKKSADFTISLLYADTSLLPVGEEEQIATYTIRADNHVKSATTPISLRLAHDTNGCVTLLDAYYEKKVEYSEDVKVEFTEEEYAAAEAKEAQEQQAKEAEQAAEKAETDKEEKTESEKPKEKPKERKKRYKTVSETKTRKEKVYLAIDATIVNAFSPEGRHLLATAEKEMLENDQRVRETEHMKNAIESYSYEIREQLYEGEPLYDYFKPEVCESFGEKLDNVVDWLYDEGEHETLEVYTAKMKELKAIGDAGVKRRKAKEARENAIETFNEVLAHYQAFIISQDEKYAHIGAEARQKVADTLTEATAWCTQQAAEQKKKPLYEDPTFTAAKIYGKIDEIHSICRPIENTPVPKKEEEKPATAEGEDKKADAPPSSEEK